MPYGSEPPQKLRENLIYHGRKFDFEANRLRLPNQSEGDWECIRHPGGALAVPLTNDGKLAIVRQYRFAAQGRLLEFPAGTIEVGESPESTIEREIQEEVGYVGTTWRKLGEFFLAPGYSDEIIYAFLATDLTKLEVPPTQDEDEDIEVVLMTPDEVETAILNGEMTDGKSMAAFLLAKPYL
ncbi:NUDIX hydrolase [filamentous cyanobacterium LEGE 11480]|uniref:NUDIX hydrolase n=1 Tax=Romeriopsis navalis LEGE 11480 TaxID=2777977 RepID=A0A928VLN7_9CYAN|nr:NUDIX hydrolase [Romeriopsis navalis]MBE9028795.1 NUDIX hydrolase [Romeriopsis navalis LEGE 11480]